MYLVLLFIFTAAWLIYGFSLGYRDFVLAKHGETVTARVTGHETSNGTIFYPLLSYTFKGQYHEVRYAVGNKKRFDTAVPLPIRVCEKWPEKPQIADTSNRRTMVFSLIVGGVSLLFSIYLCF